MASSIVFGTTLTPACQPLADVAALLAKRLNAPLRLVHVSEDPRAPIVLGTDEEHILGRVRAELDEEAERLRTSTGADVHVHLAAGNVVDALVSVARFEMATALLLGDSSTGGRAFLGTTAERAARQSTVPALTLRAPGRLLSWLRGERPLRVLVGADLGRASEAARVFASTMGAVGPIEVEVVLVASPAEVHERLGLRPPESEHRLSTEAEEALVRDLRRMAPPGETTLKLRVHAARGSADAHLASLADQGDFDLVVVGQRRHSLIEQLWYGSVARGVLRSAPVSVACVPPTFVMMGLLVFPSQWSGLWVDGVVLFVALTLVARPAAVWLGTLGMGFEAKERIFMSWAGLRGAVPIVLATYPMAAGIPVGQDVFNLVFFAVILSVGIQGSTIGMLAKRFSLSTPSRPQPRYGLDLVTMAHSDLELVVVDLPDPKGRPGPRIRDLTLPPGAMLTLVTRGDEVVAPTGNTRLLGWDQVTVLAHAKDEADVRSALLEPFDRPLTPDKPEPEAINAKVTESLGVRADEPLHDHVVLLGHGDVGSVLTRFLRLREIPFVVIEQDHTTVMALRGQGVRVVHGHGEDPDLLVRAGITDAKMFLVTATQPVAARRAIEHAQRLNPQLDVIARVHHDSLLNALSGLPRTRAVQGDVELAYAMARFMLLASGMSAIETEALIFDARRGEPGTTPTRFVEIPIPPTSPVVGQRLAELAIPPGSLVVKILRGGEVIVPGGQTGIRADDVLFVLTDLGQARTIEHLVNPNVPGA